MAKASRKRTPRRTPAAVGRRMVPARQQAVAATSGVAPGAQALSTYLAVANVTATVAFLEQVMGFDRGVALADTDGQLRYAEMRHGESAVMLVRRGDELSPSGGAAALYTYVKDVDQALAHAREAGAAVTDIEDKPWGDRVGSVTDPDGYRWLLATFRKLVPFTEP